MPEGRESRMLLVLTAIVVLSCITGDLYNLHSLHKFAHVGPVEEGSQVRGASLEERKEERRSGEEFPEVGLAMWKEVETEFDSAQERQKGKPYPQASSTLHQV